MTELLVFWGLVFADQYNDVGFWRYWFLCVVLFLTQLFLGWCWVCARSLWRKGQFWRALWRVHLVLILPDLHKHSQSAAAERPSVLRGVTLIHLSYTHQHHSLLFTHFPLSSMFSFLFTLSLSIQAPFPHIPLVIPLYMDKHNDKHDFWKHHKK